MRSWPDPDRRDGALARLRLRVERQPPRFRGRRVELGEGELRALEALSHGVGYQGASELLDVSLDTVKEQMRLARHVLGAKDTTSACCEAIRRGLIR